METLPPALTSTSLAYGGSVLLRISIRWRPSGIESALTGGLTPRFLPSISISPHGWIANWTLPVFGTAELDWAGAASTVAVVASVVAGAAGSEGVDSTFDAGGVAVAAGGPGVTTGTLDGSTGGAERAATRFSPAGRKLFSAPPDVQSNPTPASPTSSAGPRTHAVTRRDVARNARAGSDAAARACCDARSGVVDGERRCTGFFGRAFCVAST